MYYIYIYILPPRGLSTMVKELMAATYVMQSSSNKLSTPVSDNARSYKKIPELTKTRLNGCAVRY